MSAFKCINDNKNSLEEIRLEPIDAKYELKKFKDIDTGDIYELHQDGSIFRYTTFKRFKIGDYARVRKTLYANAFMTFDLEDNGGKAFGIDSKMIELISPHNIVVRYKHNRFFISCDDFCDYAVIRIFGNNNPKTMLVAIKYFKKMEKKHEVEDYAHERY